MGSGRAATLPRRRRRCRLLIHHIVLQFHRIQIAAAAVEVVVAVLPAILGRNQSIPLAGHCVHHVESPLRVIIISHIIHYFVCGFQLVAN